MIGGCTVERAGVKGEGYSSRIISDSVGIPGCGGKTEEGKVWRGNGWISTNLIRHFLF